jgi:hypothetical protein
MRGAVSGRQSQQQPHTTVALPRREGIGEVRVIKGGHCLKAAEAIRQAMHELMEGKSTAKLKPCMIRLGEYELFSEALTNNLVHTRLHWYFHDLAE